MLAASEKQIREYKKVSIRYDNLSRTYYCFYHRRDNTASDLILSYDLNEGKWAVDTLEYKYIFETKLNDLFNDEHIPFEEQLRYVIDHLDTYFANQSQQQQKMKMNAGQHRVYSLPWFRRARDTRRWASQNNLVEQSTALQRYSAPEKSIYTNNHEQLVSVKTLAESFYNDDICRNRTKTLTSSPDYSNEHNQTQTSNKAPPVSEIWLNVSLQVRDKIRESIGNHINEEKLKKLAEKFVTYFGGTFQCNVGHQYQLDYDCQKWHFIVHRFEFLTDQTDESTKIPKTKIVFLIDGVPHYVRG